METEFNVRGNRFNFYYDETTTLRRHPSICWVSINGMLPHKFVITIASHMHNNLNEKLDKNKYGNMLYW